MKTFILLSVCLAVASAVDVRLGFPKDDFSNFGGRVVGGKEATPYTAPHIVSMQNGGFHFCGGSIIGPKHVVTAAHCLGSSTIDVVAGIHDNKQVSGGQTRRVTKAIRHPSYSGGVGPYDIALLVLGTPFTLNERVQIVALPQAGAIHSGQVDLFGWGRTDSNLAAPSKLMTVNKPIVLWSTCKSVLPSNAPLHETNVCTGPVGSGISACNGDSGGPLTQSVNGKLELVGVVSWGYVPCGASGMPSIYTRTSAFTTWVNDQIRANP